MLEFLNSHPGWPHVAAATLPLIVGVLTLLAGAARNLARSAASGGGFPAWAYRRLGGDVPTGLWLLLNVGSMAVSAALGVIGLLDFDQINTSHFERMEWIGIGPSRDRGRAVSLEVGYHIDQLTAILFAMVGVVAVLVFVFSIGYMREEGNGTVEDHEADTERRGRSGRYFAYLSLFVAAMLYLLIADNLLQMFMCWELVGVCSYLLVGFYSELPAAAGAATKAFIVNRVGDAGFLIAIVIAWASFGTLNVKDLSARVNQSLWSVDYVETLDGKNPEQLAIWRSNARRGGLNDNDIKTHEAVSRNQSEQFIRDHGTISHLLWVVMGLGLFLGAVGKSAQIPLHVWLPDAMAGPTPVSALIHAATMVAAGVYLVARCNMLFAAEVYLTTAYTGAITLFLGATAACVQTDIKRVLAYSTISQLGFMMLSLGVTGWSAGMFHLVAHAFFKALLFLSAGSVIYGLHHEQDLRLMGGLRSRMPVTAITMLFGVLAISGCPPFSGWYSKEAVLSAAATFALAYPDHTALFVLPLMTAGLTAFYMFRLWLLAFTGEPRDRELHDHAQESPSVMIGPLLILAFLSLVVGWGWPLWEPSASFLGEYLEGPASGKSLPHGMNWGKLQVPRLTVEKYHLAVEAAAGLAAAFGCVIAIWRYSIRPPIFAAPHGIQLFFAHAWYFDALYRTFIVRPALRLAFALAATDKRPGSTDGAGSDPSAARFDLRTLDGWLNAVGLSAATAGANLRRLQTGWVRGYVLALGLTVVGLLGMLAALNR